MECERAREQLSARLDGEDALGDADALAAHLDGCAACRAWEESAAAVTRSARLAPADVPDLTEPIMRALNAELAGRPPAGRAPAAWWQRLAGPSDVAPVFRIGLGLVALAHFVLAAPGLFNGNDLGAPIHVAREQGSFFAALAVGLALAAWRPVRAKGMLPLVTALVVALTVTTAIDVAAGRASASAEAPHLVSLLGLAMLWLVAHPPVIPGRPSRPASHSSRFA